MHPQALQKWDMSSYNIIAPALWQEVRDYVILCLYKPNYVQGIRQLQLPNTLPYDVQA